jgi:hypothetical protein
MSPGLCGSPEFRRHSIEACAQTVLRLGLVFVCTGWWILFPSCFVIANILGRHYAVNTTYATTDFRSMYRFTVWLNHRLRAIKLSNLLPISGFQRNCDPCNEGNKRVSLKLPATHVWYRINPHACGTKQKPKRLVLL